MNAPAIVTAGIDITVDGLTARLVVSLPPLAASGPLAGHPTPGATALEMAHHEVQAACRSLLASEPSLRQAFEQLRQVVQETQSEILQAEIDHMRTELGGASHSVRRKAGGTSVGQQGGAE